MAGYKLGTVLRYVIDNAHMQQLVHRSENKV